MYICMTLCEQQIYVYTVAKNIAIYVHCCMSLHVFFSFNLIGDKWDDSTDKHIYAAVNKKAAV